MKKIYAVLFSLISVYTNAQFSGGNGTPSSPYQIANKADLKKLCDSLIYWDKHFIQTADINFTSTDFQPGGDFYYGGLGFRPIGNDGNDMDTVFTGSYNGQGHVIDSLYINRPNEYYIGFFGYVNTTDTIQNVQLTNVNITGSFLVAGLCAEIHSAYVSNCFVSGSVTGTVGVGGMIGQTYSLISNGLLSSTFNNCNVQCIVNANDWYSGGFIAYNEGVINNCSVSGTINGSVSITGGFCGQNNGGNISKSYFTGVVNSSGDQTGGFLGNNDGNGIIDSCYANGNVWGSSSHTGGFVGRNYASIINSYFNGSVASSGNQTGGFVGMNETTGIIDSCYANAVVTGGTYEAAVFAGWNKNIITNSYALGQVNGAFGVGGFAGNNTDTIINCYSNVTVTGLSNQVGGFCGNNAGPTAYISLSYSKGNVNGNGSALTGGFVGTNNWGAKISDCYSLANVSGVDIVGGFAGDNYGSGTTIENCYATGSVIGNNNVGGFVGRNFQASINISYSTGDVSGNSLVGGFVGYNEGATISNTYSRGDATANNNAAGGFCGQNYNGTLTNSYSTGKPSASIQIGGFVANNNMPLYNCFWDTILSGVQNSMGGIGLPTNQMQTQTTYTSANWDFVGETQNGINDIWKMNSCTNDGYPVFSWQQLVTQTYSTININACSNYASPSGNYTWTTSGTYMDTIPNAAGCDSIITINLTIYNPAYDTLTVSECNSYTWLQNGQTYTLSGLYVDTVAGAVGGVCDSVYVLNLSIYNPVVDTVTVSACTNYTWTQTGQTYTTTGVYTDTVSGAVNGVCDSVYVLNLTIYNPVVDTVTVSACDSYTWSQTGETYTSTGYYTDTIVGGEGGVCDRVVVLDLTINTIDVSISDSLTYLTANQPGADYQWVICPSYDPIYDATNQTFNASLNGFYAVIVSLNGCVDTSACVTVSNVSVDEISNTQEINIYPNPTNTGDINIDLGKEYNMCEVKVTDITGKITAIHRFKNQQLININIEGAKGVYFVEISTDKGYITSKKILKN